MNSTATTTTAEPLEPAAVLDDLERRGRALRLLKRLTAGVREHQLARLLDSRELLKKKLQEIPNQMQLLTNQVRLLLELVEDYYDGRYRKVRWYSLGIAVAAALYFMSPSDLIPDYLPAIGQIDDILVIGLALRLLKRELRAYVEFRGLDPADYFRAAP